MYMVHMGINQRLDKARQKHPSWLGKPEEHIALLLYGNGFDSVRALLGWRIFPRPELCAHGRAGLRQLLTHVRALRRESRVCCPSWQLCGGQRNEGESHESPGSAAGHSAWWRPSPLRKAWASASRRRAPKIPGTGQGRCCGRQVACFKAVCKETSLQC